MSDGMRLVVIVAAAVLYVGIGLGIGAAADFEKMSRCGVRQELDADPAVIFGWPIILTAAIVVQISGVEVPPRPCEAA